MTDNDISRYQMTDYTIDQGATIDRLIAERDAALADVERLDNALNVTDAAAEKWLSDLTKARELFELILDDPRLVVAMSSDILVPIKSLISVKSEPFESKVSALQQRLTAADVLEVALRKIKARLDAYAEADMRMPEPSVEVCQAIAGAALKMAQGGDEYRKSCEAAHKALSMENQRIVAPGQFKCLACGDVHPGSGNLPCPKMSPTA